MNNNSNKNNNNMVQYHQSEIEDFYRGDCEDWFCVVAQIICHIKNVSTFQRKLLPPLALTRRDAGDSSFL
jgi:hypothetical protein